MIAATIRQAQLKIKTGVVIGRLTVEMTWVLMMAPLLAVLFDEARPVPVRLAQVVLLVFVEIVLDSQVVLHQQASVNDLPCFDLDGGLVSLARAVCAVAAELRLVLRRLFVKGGFVFRGCEVVLRPAIFRLELRAALDRPIVSKKGHRIVALDGNSVVIQILQFFGGCDRRQRHKQQESRKQTLHLQIPSFFRFSKSVHSHQTRQGVRSDTNKKGKELLSPPRSPRIAWEWRLEVGGLAKQTPGGLRCGKSCSEDHHERDWLTNPDRFFASRSLR